MSSDFLVDTSDRSEPKFVLQAKYVDSLNDSRTVEKLELERRYWQQKEVPWYLVTEREIDAIAKENIDWLYVLKGELEVKDMVEVRVNIATFDAVLAENPKLNIISLCKTIDQAYHLEPGESLYDFRMLCAARAITFDLRKPFRKLTANDFTLHSLEALKGVVNVAS